MDPPPVGREKGGRRMNRVNPEGSRFRTALFLLCFLSVWPALAPGAGWGRGGARSCFSPWKSAERIALEKNKDIQKAKEYRNTVMGRYIEERSAALPQFGVNAYVNHGRDESQKEPVSGPLPL